MSGAPPMGFCKSIEVLLKFLYNHLPDQVKRNTPTEMIFSRMNNPLYRQQQDIWKHVPKS